MTHLRCPVRKAWPDFTASLMRDGRIAERRAWVIALQENDYR